MENRQKDEKNDIEIKAPVEFQEEQNLTQKQTQDQSHNKEIDIDVVKAQPVATETVVDSLSDDLYKQLVQIMHGEKLNLTNVLAVTRKLIQLVNVYNTHGLEKKALVISVLKRFLEIHMKDEPDIGIIFNYIVDLLPFFIDEITGVMKKKTSLKCCF
jgi:hypothetical protein